MVSLDGRVLLHFHQNIQSTKKKQNSLFLAADNTPTPPPPTYGMPCMQSPYSIYSSIYLPTLLQPIQRDDAGLGRIQGDGRPIIRPQLRPVRPLRLERHRVEPRVVVADGRRHRLERPPVSLQAEMQPIRQIPPVGIGPPRPFQRCPHVHDGDLDRLSQLQHCLPVRAGHLVKPVQLGVWAPFGLFYLQSGPLGRHGLGSVCSILSARNTALD